MDIIVDIGMHVPLWTIMCMLQGVTCIFKVVLYIQIAPTNKWRGWT